jgi:hypothetical protein
MSGKSKKYIHPAKRDRIKNAKKLQESRPLTSSNFHNLKESLQGKSFGSFGHNYVPVGPSFPRSSVTREDKRRLDALGVIGGKKSRKKRRRKKKKSRKKKKKTRRRKKKGGILFTGALAYGLYQTQMNGKKAVFNLPVQYVDPPQPSAEPTPAPATGGKRTRKRKRKKRRKTRKRKGGADSLRDGIRKIYEGRKASMFNKPIGPGSWGRQLNDLYDRYQEHLYQLSKGQKAARTVKNVFRSAKTKKPLTEGEADIIFYTEAMTMKSILNDMLLRKKSSIEEINMNPDAMIYSERQRESDHKYERLSRLIEEERPRLSEEAEELEGSIFQLEQLIAYIKRSDSNSIPRHGSSIETNFSDSENSFDTAPQLDVLNPELGRENPYNN